MFPDPYLGAFHSFLCLVTPWAANPLALWELRSKISTTEIIPSAQKFVALVNSACISQNFVMTPFSLLNFSASLNYFHWHALVAFVIGQHYYASNMYVALLVDCQLQGHFMLAYSWVLQSVRFDPFSREIRFVIISHTSNHSLTLITRLPLNFVSCAVDGWTSINSCFG